jgi:N-acetyl-anhydromuramyl-L-alanine amidase AmpD
MTVYRFDVTAPLRTEPLDLIVCHWTAGLGGPEQVARTLAARKLSVHYVIGTAGEVVQMASTDRRCAHAGHVNGRSIGIEVVSPGLPGTVHDREMRSGVRRRSYADHIRGRRVAMLDFTDAQTAALTALVESLCDSLSVPRAVPVEANGDLARRELSPREQAAFRGVAGHFHFHATKLDCGSAPLERLRLRWAKPLAERGISGCIG